MAGTAWTKFFWSDWSNDPSLRMCSMAAQGFWMRCLCIAAEADPTGYVVVNERPLDGQDLARLTGVSVPEAETWLQELDRNGVFSRDRKGRIYSRRMVRDAKIASRNRKNGQQGGNPTLSKTKGIPPSDNPPDKGGVKPHKPYANSHKPEIEPLPSSPTTPLGAAGQTDYGELENWLRGLVGEDQPCSAHPDISPIVGLLRAGYDRSEVQIGIRTALSRGVRAKAWTAFVSWITGVRERADRAQAAGAAAPPPKPAASGAHPPGIHEPQFPGDTLVEIVDAGRRSAALLREHIANWRRTGEWPGSGWGRPPGEAGCYIPARFLIEEVSHAAGQTA
jgi:hypothetical protein